MTPLDYVLLWFALGCATALLLLRVLRRVGEFPRAEGDINSAVVVLALTILFPPFMWISFVVVHRQEFLVALFKERHFK